MNSIPVFLASDDKYAPFVATTIASICSNTKSQIEFYILDGGISFKNKRKIRMERRFFNNFTIEFISVDVKERFGDLPNTEYFSKDMYSRLLIPELKPNLNKAIYTDVDIIFTGDIDELYEISIAEFPIAAVNTYIVTDETRNDLNQRVDRLNLKNVESLFNSGVLILNCKKWRENNISVEIINLAKELALLKKLKLPDQDVLNKFFDGNYFKLDMKWNVAYSCLYGRLSEDKFQALSKRQKVVHFAGIDKYKPWNNKNTYGAEDFWRYVHLTYFLNEIIKINEKFIKSKQTVAGTKSAVGIKQRLLRIIIKCLVDSKRYKKLKKEPSKFFEDTHSRIIKFLGKYYY